MNSKFEERLRYWLRQASEEASRGFMYDKDEAEMNENWENFEKTAIEDIDNFMSMEKIITFLANIKRFPSLEIWKDIQGIYHAQCSPSFDTCEGTASDLTEALIALLKDLKDYFTKEEINKLKIN